MKRLFAILPLLALLLTACSTPNAGTNDQAANAQQVEQSANSTATNSEEPKHERPDRTNTKAPTQVRPDRTKKEDEPEGIARFELNETFQNLLDKVNTEHEAIMMYDGDYEQYYIKNEEPGFNIKDYTLPIMSGIDGTAANDLPSGTTVLTLDQVKEDLEICYKALRTKYGCYEYLGGDGAFRPAIDAVIADCAEMETITFSAMNRSLRERMTFIKDMHFEINGASLDGYEYIVPFHFRNIAYLKTEHGYETPDGKVVASVDGYEDMDELFKLSLTKEGDLVYYPILLGPSKLTLGPAKCNTPELTVRYTDGSTDILTTSTYKNTVPFRNGVNIREEAGIPTIVVGTLMGGSHSWIFERSAYDYKDRDIVMLDLRYCNGGMPTKAENWCLTYAGRLIWTNEIKIREGDFVANQYALRHTDEEFASMDNVCIMLSSKGSSSATQTLIGMGYNMENTLIIGENTTGNLIGSTGYVVKLPNSGTLVEFGPSLSIYSEDHFEEYRGFFPDIWCPADEAKEAVMNFIEKNTTVTYEEAKR